MTRLAKLTQPRLARVHPRERLFERLDAARAHPVVWIVSPPGAGKTTLVASYLAARGLAASWYQVDAGDGDPASFFYYLRELAPRPRLAELPLLTPEYRADLDGFTRRFFRSFFAAAGRRTILVLDNFQDAPAGSPFATLIRDAVAELPSDFNLVIVSRGEPPADFARLHANRSLTILAWDALQLTREETAAIVALNNSGPSADVDALHVRCGAWAAGLTLLLESEGEDLGAGVPRLNPANEHAPRALFDYLAAEIFEQAPPDLRGLWLGTAYMPNFTAAMAVQISGNPRSAALLERLVRERYFVDRRSGAEPVYQYHPLFQEFLRHQVERVCDADQRRQLAKNSAALLDAQGSHSEALDLYCLTEDWEAAIGLVLRQAPALFASGRVATLVDWLGMLPGAALETTPWLKFWTGSCQALIGGPAFGRKILEETYSSFAHASDVIGQLLAAATVIETYFIEMDSFVDVDPWIERVQALLATDPSFPELGMELRVRANMLLALSYRQPQSELAHAFASQVWSLCRADLQPAEKLTATAQLVAYLAMGDSIGRTQEAIVEFGALAGAPGTTPMQKIMWLWAISLYQLGLADFEAVRKSMAQAETLSRLHGLPLLLGHIQLMNLWIDLPAGKIEAALQTLDRIGGEIDHSRPIDIAFYHYMRAWAASLTGSKDAALMYAEQAARLAKTPSVIGPKLCTLGGYAYALAECGELDHALQVAREASAVVSAPYQSVLRFNALVVEADVLRRLGRRDECLATLRKALATGRLGGFLNCHQWRPRMMSALCGLALENGIETAYVERLIRVRGLAAESPEVECWPWPVRIYTLGRLSVVIEGEPLIFEGKTQRKPLELLKAVLAHGGRAVDQGTLMAEI